MMMKPGTWLNHYQILGHLGTGGNQSRARKQAVKEATTQPQEYWYNYPLFLRVLCGE